VVPSDDVWAALGIHATGDHRVFVNGWVRMRDIGERMDGSADVVRLTVADAHTYYSKGILSHNEKQYDS
jgi:intein/homing endonuclease